MRNLTEPVDPHSVIPTSRDYDYGPGSNAAAAFNLFHRGRPLFRAEYELHHLHIIDGTRANYLLQRFRVDLNVPLRGRLGAGVTGDYLRRQTFYQNGTKSRLAIPGDSSISQLERAMTRRLLTSLLLLLPFIATAAAAQQRRRRHPAQQLRRRNSQLRRANVRGS